MMPEKSRSASVCGVLIRDDWDTCKRVAYWHLSNRDDAPYCKPHARIMAMSAGADYIWTNHNGGQREVMPMADSNHSETQPRGQQ